MVVAFLTAAYKTDRRKEGQTDGGGHLWVGWETQRLWYTAPEPVCFFVITGADRENDFQRATLQWYRLQMYTETPRNSGKSDQASGPISREQTVCDQQLVNNSSLHVLFF